MKSFRELRIWQAAMDLVEKVYLLTRSFPKQETYGLTSQLQRAAVSIPSNIAEGHTREHLKEYLHHLSMAQASLAELETQLEIALRLKYLTAGQLKELMDDSNSLGKQMYSLRNALRRT
ncbi:MAG: four helix bundle protein [Pyrinomonadaceae bacterium]